MDRPRCSTSGCVLEKISDKKMNRGLHKSMEGREDVVEVRCPRWFHLHHLVPQILFCWDAGAFIARALNGSKDGGGSQVRTLKL